LYIVAKDKATSTGQNEKVNSQLFMQLLPLNLCTNSVPSTTRILESADVMSTSDELPGANCSMNLISNTVIFRLHSSASSWKISEM